MDPTGSAAGSSASKEETAIDEAEKVILAKVLVKCYKVLEVEGEDKVSRPGTKFLNTKTFKVEAALKRTDFESKQALITAIEQAIDIDEVAREEGIVDPKCEISVMRKETSEVYKISTNMKILTQRLDKIEAKEDSFLVEVKEQVLSFQPKSPTIKILVNMTKVVTKETSGRMFTSKVVQEMNSSLKDLGGSSYSSEFKKVICGQCKRAVKPRSAGNAKSIVEYFKEHHFAKCGNLERKRKAKEQLEAEKIAKKAKEVENNNRFWVGFRRRAEPIEEERKEYSDDEVIDADLESDAGLEEVGLEDPDLRLDDVRLEAELNKCQDKELKLDERKELDGSDSEEESDNEEFYDCSELFDVELSSEFCLPFKVSEPPSEVALQLNKLVKNGTLSTKSYFYKNVKEVLNHLESPLAEWDPEICEALLSIQHVGGAAALNYVVGPLGRHGAGDFGVGNHGVPLINYGGPGRTTLQKHRPGTMPVSGISKHLLLSILQLLELSEMMVPTQSSLLSLVCMQLDGTMVKAGIIRVNRYCWDSGYLLPISGLYWDEKLGLVLGLESPLTYSDMEKLHFTFDPEYLKRKLVTEVDVCVLSSLCSKVALSVGYRLQSNSGKSGEQLLAKYSETIKIASRCEACVRSEAPTLNAVDSEILTKCSSYCEDCWNTKQVCDRCALVGRQTIYPQLEACYSCLENGIKCRKNCVLVVALDCFSGNRYLMEKFRDQMKEGTRDPELFLTEAIAEIVHVLKTMKSSASNWYILTPCGTLYNLSMLRTLRDGNGNKMISSLLRESLQRGSVVNRDRQDTDCLIEFSELGQVLEKVCGMDPVVVHQIVPEKYKLEPTNKPGDLGEIVGIGPININHVAVLCKETDDTYSISSLELHNPVRIGRLLTHLENVTSFSTSEGIVVFSTKQGLNVLELVKGCVIPRIPVRKADLIQLCAELNLDCCGKVSELKARLKKVLDPIAKTKEGILAKQSGDLKNSIISKFAVQSGVIKSLVAASDNLKQLYIVELIIGRGEVTAKIQQQSSYSELETVVSIETIENKIVTLLASNSLTIYDDSLGVLSTIDLKIATKDICSADTLMFFLHENTISVETLSKLEDGEYDPRILVGAEKSSKGDGSGNTSSVRRGSKMASYQRTVFVGSSDGRVKIISLLKPIAKFYSRTFKPAVEGFGLHKKNKRGTSANLETAREAYVKMGEYIEDCETNIRENFILQLPAKLNGPQHMISAVTKSSIEMASESYQTIQDNIKLVQTLKVDQKSLNAVKDLDTAQLDVRQFTPLRVDSVDEGEGDREGLVEKELMSDELKRVANLKICDLSMYNKLPDNLRHLSLVDICESLFT